jgi:hypothetical protein
MYEVSLAKKWISYKFQYDEKNKAPEEESSIYQAFGGDRHLRVVPLWLFFL